MAPPQPGVTPESIQQITERLDRGVEQLSRIADNLGKLATTVDRYRPAMDRAARLADSPVGKIMTRAASARRH